MNKWFLLISILLFVGCTTTGQPYSPPPPAPQGKALVHFIRTEVFHGNFWPTIFAVNDTKIVSLYDNGYSWIYLDSGTYKFSAGDLLSPDYTNFSMAIEAGQEYFLEYNQERYFGFDKNVFQALPHDEGKSLLATYSYKEANKVEIQIKPKN